MLLVQRGLRALQGLPAAHAARTARQIHIPTAPRAPPANSTTARTARNLLNRFVYHLTAPGLGAEAGHGARALHSGRATIQQGFSLPVRHALGRPLGAPHLPRPPKIPGNISNVGLGTARKFSTARPLFQNMVENVPIAGRAFWEVDWDEKMRQEKAKLSARKMQKKNAKKTSAVFNATLQVRKENLPVSETTSVSEDLEFDRYFPTAALAPVTTYLSIPLAPTPTARHPLRSAPRSTDAPLLPLAALGATHALHGTHSARVSSLFSRLDAANVWGRGASCTAHGDRSGLCTVLLVAFEGWDERMVREVVGEDTHGWCELSEVHKDLRPDTPSDMSLSGLSRYESTPAEFADPAASLVLPSTDLSATEFPFGFPRNPAESISNTPFSSTPSSILSSPASSPRLAPGHLGTGLDFDDAFSLSDRLSYSASDIAVDSVFELRMPEQLMSEAEEEMSEWGSEFDASSGSDAQVDCAPLGSNNNLGFSSAVESQWGEVWHA